MNTFLFFVLALGLFEIASNLYHLSKGTIIKIGASGKKQHQEISVQLNEIHFFVKVLIMFFFGILLSASAGICLITKEAGFTFLFTSILLFGLYGLFQAVYYRKPYSVWSSAIVYNIPLVVFIILK